MFASACLLTLCRYFPLPQVSGVPPDAFSATGQLWGSPLYDWPKHQAQGYVWWADRIGRAMQLFDETRIDHFRGFAGYWSIDATSETAMIGDWREGPGLELFLALKAKLGGVPILAEDLGVITTDVVELRCGWRRLLLVKLHFYAWNYCPTLACTLTVITIEGIKQSLAPHSLVRNCAVAFVF